MKKENIAAIDIGSSSIRMTICEVTKNEYDVLEKLRRPVRLGKDCFYNGKISRQIINECVLILKKYKKLCEEYKVTKIYAAATTAVREAGNVDVFLDNIRTLTNIDIEILSPSKESEYIYLALSNRISQINDNNKKEYWGIVKIGTGNVQITLLDDQCIIFTRSLPLGIMKIKQIFIKEFNREENFHNFLRVMIEHELQNLKRNIPLIKINKLYVIGFEIEALSKILTKKENDLSQISKNALQNLCLKIQNYTEEEITHKLKIPYELSETFYPASIIFLKIVNFFKCENIYIPRVSLRDGIIRSKFFISNKKKYFQKLEIQLIANAINLGRSLNFDEKHAIKVMDIAIKIFSQTKDIHYLDNIERCYLIVASILHDIGSTLSYRSHHKHSLYIIKAQDFFSFDKNEINIIANIARYHRKSGPKNSHPDYISLSHKDRMIVMKLASILRIADSLDNTHLQLIKDIELSKNDNKIIIYATVKEQFFSEVYSFNYKKKLFEDFFGLDVILKIKE